jgi:predicted nuclease of predicted toxin-antitoxin system
MGTLASELGSFAAQIVEEPRVYADANVPAGLVRFMRDRLRWDVLFVMEEDDLRRAADIEHFRLASQLRRTLLTLDHDYLDDKLFPCGSCGGVVVLSAPDETQCRRLLNTIDRVLFRGGSALPLLGRKLHVHTDWTGQLEPTLAGSR